MFQHVTCGTTRLYISKILFSCRCMKQWRVWGTHTGTGSDWVESCAATCCFTALRVLLLLSVRVNNRARRNNESTQWGVLRGALLSSFPGLNKLLDPSGLVFLLHFSIKKGGECREGIVLWTAVRFSEASPRSMLWWDLSWNVLRPRLNRTSKVLFREAENTGC